MIGFSVQSGPIGLDIGLKSVAAFQVRWAGGKAIASAAVIVDRKQAEDNAAFSADEAEHLEQVLYRQGFHGREIVLAVPDQHLLSGVLELPPRASGAPLDQIARMEIARAHKKDPGSFEMACWDIPPPARAGEFTYVMASACTHDASTPLLDALESTGFRVTTLDTRPWALTRACGPRLASAGLSAVLDAGESGALLTVVHKGVPVYERLMPEAGLRGLRARIQSELSLEPDVADYVLSAAMQALGGTSGGTGRSVEQQAANLLEEHVQGLLTEVQSAVEYITHRYATRVESLLLTGSAAGARGLVERLGSGLNLPASVVTPAELLDCPAALHGACRTPRLAAAIGLALAGSRRAA
jgi:Tfp pilus assembly PilM family ATPase